MEFPRDTWKAWAVNSADWGEELLGQRLGRSAGLGLSSLLDSQNQSEMKWHVWVTPYMCRCVARFFRDVSECSVGSKLKASRMAMPAWPLAPACWEKSLGRWERNVATSQLHLGFVIVWTMTDGLGIRCWCWDSVFYWAKLVWDLHQLGVENLGSRNPSSWAMPPHPKHWRNWPERRRPGASVARNPGLVLDQVGSIHFWEFMCDVRGFVILREWDLNSSK